MDFLPAVRRSIEVQTCGDFEILILDNACPPDARGILEAWARDDPRVTLLRAAERLPMFKNFNRGLAAARGEFVAFCHDDDELLPSFVARHVDFMDAHPQVGISGSSYVVTDSTGGVVERRRAVRHDQIWDGRRYVRSIVRRGRNPLTMQSIFYRLRALPPGGLDESLSLHFGDFVFLMRIAERCDVGLLAEPLLRVRAHGGQASAAMPLSEGVPLRSRMMRAYCAHFRERFPHESAFADSLERDIDAADRLALVWGWLSADTEEESLKCLRALDDTEISAGLRALFAAAERALPATSRGRRHLLSFARRLKTG